MTISRAVSVAGWLLAVLVVFVSLQTSAGAQSASTGALTGTIKSQNGVPLEGAEVTLEGHERATTDSQGRFTFSRVSPGNYRLSVTKSGFPTGSRALMIRAGATERTEMILRGYAEPPAVMEGQATVPLIRHGNVFLIQALLNTRRQAIFILDTGASLTTISTAVAQELGINFGPGSPSRTLHTASGEVQAFIATLESIRVGGVEARDVQVAIMDLPRGGQVIGLLGNTFLSRFRVQLDAAQELLVLSQ